MLFEPDVTYEGDDGLQIEDPYPEYDEYRCACFARQCTYAEKLRVFLRFKARFDQLVIDRDAKDKLCKFIYDNLLTDVPRAFYTMEALDVIAGIMDLDCVKSAMRTGPLASAQPTSVM